MARLPNADAVRRNKRPEASSAVPESAPRLRDLSKHHPSTRKWWTAICKSPQAGMLNEAAWEWLQAKAWRLDAYFNDPVNATSALAKEVDDVMGKMLVLPRDLVASGYRPTPKRETPSAAAGKGVTSLSERRNRLIAEDAS